MHKLPRLNGCGVLNETKYGFLSADEIFFNFNEPFLSSMRFKNVRSCQISSIKYTSRSRCFYERQMHKLPRLNGCEVPKERKYCFLSGSEIFFNFNEPFFSSMRFKRVGSCESSSIKCTARSRCFYERQMHKLPRLNGCGV